MPLQSVSPAEVRDELPLIPVSDPVEKESIVARAFYGIPLGSELAFEQNTFLKHDDLDAVRFVRIAHLLNQMQGEVFPDAEMLFLVKFVDDIRRVKLVISRRRLSLQLYILVGAAVAEDGSSELISGIELVGTWASPIIYY